MVHQLVGGMVEHVPCDEGGPDSETTLLLQKLYSMNVLAYEGWDPNMEFWEVCVLPCVFPCVCCACVRSLQSKRTNLKAHYQQAECSA